MSTAMSTERFGRYQYWRNDETVDVIEEFSISGSGTPLPLRPDSASVWSRRVTSTGASIEVRSGADLVAVSFAMSGSAAGATTVGVELHRDGSEIICARTINDGEAVVTSAPFPAAVSPILRVFQGPAIAELAQLGSDKQHGVLIPWIYDPSDIEKLLGLNIEQRRSWREADGTYRYVGGNYDDSAEFDLDRNGQLLRYVWPQRPDSVWTVDLISSTETPIEKPES
jgi:hypothetical protein